MKEAMQTVGYESVTTAVRPSRIANVPPAPPPPNGARQPEVAVALGYLQREVGAAHERMHALEERLSGVMRSSSPEVTKEAGEEGFSSGLATAIQEAAERVRRLNRQVEEILNRLDV